MFGTLSIVSGVGLVIVNAVMAHLAHSRRLSCGGCCDAAPEAGPSPSTRTAGATYQTPGTSRYLTFRV